MRALTSFFSFVFLALQIYFWGQGDDHMVTLMCGLCVMCGGILWGWLLAGKSKQGR